MAADRRGPVRCAPRTVLVWIAPGSRFGPGVVEPLSHHRRSLYDGESCAGPARFPRGISQPGEATSMSARRSPRPRHWTWTFLLVQALWMPTLAPAVPARTRSRIKRPISPTATRIEKATSRKRTRSRSCRARTLSGSRSGVRLPARLQQPGRHPDRPRHEGRGTPGHERGPRGGRRWRRFRCADRGTLSRRQAHRCPGRRAVPDQLFRQCRRKFSSSVSIGPFFVGDLWVLAGQSNMEGVANLERRDAPPPIVSPCSGWTGNGLRAEEPLHWLVDSPDPVHSGDPARPPRSGRSKEQHQNRKKGVDWSLVRHRL